MSLYQKENDIVKGYFDKVRKGSIILGKKPMVNEQREIENEEVRVEIKKFQEYFRRKGVSANFQFGSPQKFSITMDGVLWSGTIDNSIQWFFNAMLNSNERNVSIYIEKQNMLELNENSVILMSLLKDYFDLFSTEWIEKEYNKEDEQNIEN